jgi:hypothetical protein
MSRLQLNIRAKAEDLRQLRELADLLGISATEAVRVAVAEKLRRVKGKRSGQVAA